MTSELHLYEELILLALHDESGKFQGEWIEHAISAAAITELVDLGRITIDESKKRFVDLVDPTPTGDPVLDLALDKIAAAKRRTRLNAMLPRIARLSRLKHLAAEQLVVDGVLHADTKTVLGFFDRTRYPELDPVPERNVIARLQQAIFTDGPVDSRTAMLIGLAHPVGLLKREFGAKELRARKHRLQEIVDGDVMHRATTEAIAAMMAATTTVLVATSS